MLLRPFIEAPRLADRGHPESFTIEGVTLARLLAALPTPFYATSLGAVEARARAYVEALQRNAQAGFGGSSSHVHYAMKANFAPAVLRAVARAGAGVDIVSVGEWRKARSSGIPAKAICFAGVGKRPAEWMETLEGGIGALNVEHADEAVALLDVLQAWEPVPERPLPLVSLRLNPCVELETHPHLKTGALDSKFGMLHEQALDFLAQKKLTFVSPEDFARWLRPLRGIHVHVGSQLHDPDVFLAVAKRVAAFAEALEGFGVVVTHFDLGGGLGVGPTGVPSRASDIDAHVDALCSALRAALSEVAKRNPRLAGAWGFENGSSRSPQALPSGVTLALEPGRSVVASSTCLFTTVLYAKANAPDIRFAYVDAGMNDFPRPAIYGAKHPVEFAASGEGSLVSARWLRLHEELRPWNVVGPVCESGDVLARNVMLPQVRQGDVLAFLEAGAYCRSMASHYNLRPLPAEIFVKAGDIVETTPALWPS